MSNLIQLIKVQILNLFGFNKVIHTKNKKEKFKFAFFMILITFSFLFLMAAMFGGDYYIVKHLSNQKYILEISLALSSLMIFSATIYKGSSIIFTFKDYDILVSLPIKISTISASRIINIYFSTIMINMLFMVPAITAYALVSITNTWFYIFSIILFFIIPIIPFCIATFLSIAFTIISSKFKHSNIISLIFDFIFFIGIIVITFNKDKVFEQSDKIISVINKIYPFSSLFSAAVCEHNLIAFFIFTMISIIVFIAFNFIVGKNFMKINIILNQGTKTPKYKVSQLKYSSPFCALYKKEFKKYISSNQYVSNTAFGFFLLTMSTIILFISADATFAELVEEPEISIIVSAFVPFIISLTAVFSSTTPCSISLEGKNLWILKTIPIKTTQIFNSKILVNLTVAMPFIIINSILFTLLFNSTFTYFIFMAIIPILFAIFISIIGILMNLSFPNFTWTSELNAIKQSASVILTIIVGLISVVISIGIFILSLLFIEGVIAPLAITSMCVLITDIIIYIIMKTRGVQKFYNLIS